MPTNVDFDSERGIRSAEEAARFAMSFIDQSDKMRQPFVEPWQESLGNYFVKPHGEIAWSGRTDAPYARGRGDFGSFGGAVLKDPESFQTVETFLAKIYTALFGQDNFIQARRRGIEDVGKAKTASRLIEYVLGLQGHPRTFYEWLKDGLIFSTGILEMSWDYQEDLVTRRFVEADPFSGLELSESVTVPTVLRDDVYLKNVDIMDFFPDPGQFRMDRMLNVGKRFTMTKREAMREGRNNPDWNLAGVRRAIANGATAPDRGGPPEDDTWRESIDRPNHDDTITEHHPMIGFEVWGEVPWKPKAGQSRRRVLTVLNGELVSDRNWPLHSARVPFYDVTINPVQGRFYGLSPLEVIRYDQSFVDGMKMLIADATLKATHPPPVYDANRRIDLTKLRKFRTQIPIGVEGDPRTAVNFLNYDPPLQNSFAMYSTVKNQMREGPGSLGAIQGLGLGSKRFSATEAGATFEQAFDRPEMMAQLIEKDSLPPIGKGILDLNKQFLETSEDLALRIGEAPGSVFLSDILSDYDVSFVGSRQQHNKSSRIQAMERFLSVAGNIPPVAAQIPWDEFIKIYVRELDLHELEALIALPGVQKNNILLQQILGANAQNNNGTVQGLQPAGQTPAQAGGQALV